MQLHLNDKRNVLCPILTLPLGNNYNQTLQFLGNKGVFANILFCVKSISLIKIKKIFQIVPKVLVCDRLSITLCGSYAFMISFFWNELFLIGFHTLIIFILMIKSRPNIKDCGSFPQNWKITCSKELLKNVSMKKKKFSMGK